MRVIIVELAGISSVGKMTIQSLLMPVKWLEKVTGFAYVSRTIVRYNCLTPSSLRRNTDSNRNPRKKGGGGGGEGGGGGGGGLYLTLRCHHQDDFCIKMGSDSHFNVSLTVRGKVTRQCPQITTFEEKGEPKKTWTGACPLSNLISYQSETERSQERSCTINTQGIN